MKPSELIRNVGWCRGTFFKQDSNKHIIGYCVIGAINQCYKSYRKTDEIVERLAVYLNITSVTAWNDSYGRTKNEVVAALEAIGE